MTDLERVREIVADAGYGSWLLDRRRPEFRMAVEVIDAHLKEDAERVQRLKACADGYTESVKQNEALRAELTELLEAVKELLEVAPGLGANIPEGPIDHAALRLRQLIEEKE